MVLLGTETSRLNEKEKAPPKAALFRSPSSLRNVPEMVSETTEGIVIWVDQEKFELKFYD